MIIERIMSGIMRKEINDTKAVKETKRMNLDVLGLFAACSYALDCVEGDTYRKNSTMTFLVLMLSERLPDWKPIVR